MRLFMERRALPCWPAWHPPPGTSLSAELDPNRMLASSPPSSGDTHPNSPLVALWLLNADPFFFFFKLLILFVFIFYL